MRGLLSTAAFAALLPAAAFCQFAPVAESFHVAPPSDQLDPLSSNAAITPVTTAEQRAAATGLILRASSQYAMHTQGTPAHVLQIAFNTTPTTSFAGGAGQLRETWISGRNWRWDATLGNYSLLRISSEGVAYDQQTVQPLPMRLKMLANAVFAPLQFFTPRVSPMRTATVTMKGISVTCILLTTNPTGREDPGAAPVRRWNESEVCIDPASGLLQSYSEAPGVDIAYDYSNALKFHDRILPGALTISENGAAVLQAQLTSIVDTDPNNVSPFTPTAQMKDQGPAIVLNGPMRVMRTVASPNVAAGATVEPTIVHVTMDDQGNVQESELLQSNGMSNQALELVRATKMWPVERNGGVPPRQREAYVRVEFIPTRMPNPSSNLRIN